MLNSIIRKVLGGTKHEREIKKIQPLVDSINGIEPDMRKLSDEELKAKTDTFRQRLQDGEELDDLLVEAFAVVRETSKRILKMRHFDVQLMGGIFLHHGKIAEMKTGEGKTLVATLPAYLNALSGKGVHIVTVNDYLASRDAAWMGQIYRFLGLTVGVIMHDMPDDERKPAYDSDITFGTNNEFGFDYLRDNMKFAGSEFCQRRLNYCIIDEVDSILVDEARTPLIISGPSEDSTDKYYKIDKIIPLLKDGAIPKTEFQDPDFVQALSLKNIIKDKPSQTSHVYFDPDLKSKEELIERLSSFKRDKIELVLDIRNKYETDYTIDEKMKTATLTEEGNSKVEKLLKVDNMYSIENIEIVHHVVQALRAHAIFKKDIDYVVKNGEVMIVDEFTGRLMEGRRWSDGLHQAVEAKECVNIAKENQTLATITLQNYFRMYEKISGMTGTADTEAVEFAEIYNLDVQVIPTNMPMIRQDAPDVIYRTEKEKFKAIIEEIENCTKKGQPTLVGTISIENSEKLSRELKKKGIKHEVLNAKYHEKEAEIVAQAGYPNSVTIATNMAGRGTDILLGGNPEFEIKALEANNHTLSPEKIEKLKSDAVQNKETVLKAGGLHIIGTERHESRRIDNQLRGRSGRQGDPGSSRFFLSLEDDLLRIFGSDRISGLMAKLGMEEDTPIEHKMVSRAIENAQKKVEANNYEIRKHLLDYDNVMNKQREVIYDMRYQCLQDDNPDTDITEMVGEIVDDALYVYCPENEYAEAWDLKGLADNIDGTYSITINDIIEKEELDRDELASSITERFLKKYEDKKQKYSPEIMKQVTKMLMLRTIDVLWKDHLLAMDHMKQGIGLRGYGQQDPLVEYKKEGFELFQGLIFRIRKDLIEQLMKVTLTSAADHIEAQQQQQRQQQISMNKGEESTKNKPVTRKTQKVGRNEPCPCGSGKKYKKCCGS